MKLKNFHELPSYPDDPPPVKAQIIGRSWLKGAESGLRKFCQGRELIAGGDIRWKPINKQAAMLLAKSPEICKPQHNMSTFIEDKKFDANVAKIRTANEADAALSRKLTNIHDKIPKHLLDKVDELKSIRASLDLATDMFRADMVNFTEELPKHLNTIRTWRMTMEREKELSLRAMQDIRKFFLDADHEKEIQRLNEFVRLCERLSALAKDGTLDKVAEVMLKLA